MFSSYASNLPFLTFALKKLTVFLWTRWRLYFLVSSKPIKSQGRYFLIVQRYEMILRNASPAAILTLENLVIVQKINSCAALPRRYNSAQRRPALSLYFVSDGLCSCRRSFPLLRDVCVYDGLKTAIRSALHSLRFRITTEISCVKS